MRRVAVLAYGLLCYTMFLGVFLYAIGFVGNLVPKSIDASPRVPLTQAMLINGTLLALFAVQHSLTARPTFKQCWTRFAPESIERSTYVLCSNICFVLIFCCWEPMGGVVWDVKDPFGYALLLSLFVSGWMLVLVTTFLINHFDPFGLRQVWMYFRGEAYRPVGFVTPAIYQHVRHPLYVGWLIAFWATPTMTAAHLMFALMTTAYILVAIQLEERNLVEARGFSYADYRRSVSMLVPRLTPYRSFEAATAASVG